MEIKSPPQAGYGFESVHPVQALLPHSALAQTAAPDHVPPCIPATAPLPRQAARPSWPSKLSARLAFDADFNSGKKRLALAQVRELFEALHAAQETKEEKEKPKQNRKSKKEGAQKQAKKKNFEINLRDIWIKATQRLLKGQPALAPEPAGEPENTPRPAV